MLIQSATKNYEVSIHSSFDPVKDMAVDAKTFVVIDKQVYDLYRGQHGWIFHWTSRVLLLTRMRWWATKACRRICVYFPLRS